jgi:general secretion pathway protein E
VTILPTRPLDRLIQLDPKSDKFAVDVVQLLLEHARQSRASDLHLIPNGQKQLEVFCRIDGLLQRIASIPSAASNIVSRLKVLAELLTYRTDVPQEGRIRGTTDGVEMRVSTFPTVHGEKAVVRLFAGSQQYLEMGDLSFPADVKLRCQEWLAQPQGVLLVTGPAGAGKTTTLYAALRQIQRQSLTPRSLCSLEDPIESLVPGVAQSQINPAAGFTYEVGLKSLLRQDPEVLMVGEIRDRGTAEIVFQASLTGHQVLTTFHAGRAAEACGRLLDMGIEPYIVKSGLLGILSQRLVRRLCSCSRAAMSEDDRMGWPVTHARVAVGCSECDNTGYKGRLPLVEALDPQAVGVGTALLRRADVQEIEKAAIEAGMVPLQRRVVAAIEAGQTTVQEAIRVLGIAK